MSGIRLQFQSPAPANVNVSDQ